MLRGGAEAVNRGRGHEPQSSATVASPPRPRARHPREGGDPSPRARPEQTAGLGPVKRCERRPGQPNTLRHPGLDPGSMSPRTQRLEVRAARWMPDRVRHDEGKRQGSRRLGNGDHWEVAAVLHLRSRGMTVACPGFSPSIKSPRRAPVAPVPRGRRAPVAPAPRGRRAPVAPVPRGRRLSVALVSHARRATVAPVWRGRRAPVAPRSRRCRVGVASPPRPRRLHRETAPAPQHSQHSPTSPHPPVRFERSRETGQKRHATCLDFARHKRRSGVQPSPRPRTANAGTSG